MPLESIIQQKRKKTGGKPGSGRGGRVGGGQQRQQHQQNQQQQQQHPRPQKQGGGIRKAVPARVGGGGRVATGAIRKPTSIDRGQFLFSMTNLFSFFSFLFSLFSLFFLPFLTLTICPIHIGTIAKVGAIINTPGSGRPVHSRPVQVCLFPILFFFFFFSILFQSSHISFPFVIPLVCATQRPIPVGNSNNQWTHDLHDRSSKQV